MAVGCSTSRYAVETDHYRVTFPREWQVVSHGQHDAEPTTFLVPASAQTTSEVRVYAWLERGEQIDPAGKVLQYLRAEHDTDLHLANLKDDDSLAGVCEQHAAQVSLLGSTRGVRYLVESDRWLTVVAGGHAEGSLVGVVGRIPMSDKTCSDLTALEATLQQLSNDVTAVYHPRRIAQAVTFSAMPGSGMDPRLSLPFRE